MNGDGLQDLVVGAPSAEGEDLVQVAGNYTGRVHIFLGAGKGKLPAAKPSSTIRTNVRWASLGLSLAIAPDCGSSQGIPGGNLSSEAAGTLLVGAPFFAQDENNLHQGAVGVFHARATWPRWLDLLRDADSVIVGNSPFAWMGRAINVVCTSNDAQNSSSR